MVLSPSFHHPSTQELQQNVAFLFQFEEKIMMLH